MLAYNTPEHVETLLGCWKARVVPCNVNYHYTPGEVAELLHRIGARGAVYDRRLADKLGGIADHLDLLVEMGDPAVAPRYPGAVHYDAALESGAALPQAPDPSPDDLYIACTGGTTGRPKAVLWRQGDIFVAGMGGADDLDDAALRTRALGNAGRLVPDVAAHARGRAVDHAAGDQHGRHRGAPRRLARLRRAHDPRDRGARAREHDDDRR